MDGSSEETPFVQRQRAEALEIDRQDLVAVLDLRFGGMPEAVRTEIGEIQDGAHLERLVLVAANVPTLADFVKELKDSKGSFKIVGEIYNPLAGS